MIDIKYVHSNTAELEESFLKRGATADIDEILTIDAGIRDLQFKADELRAERNRVSKEIGKLKQAGQDAENAVIQMREVGDRIAAYEQQIREAEEKLSYLLLTIPNVPLASVPEGHSDQDNREERRWGEPPKFDFKPLSHADLGEKLGLLDFERGAKIAGARFTLLWGHAAKLERALINFMLDVHTREHGYTEVLPPFLANSTSLRGTGNLPKFESDLFKCRDTDLYLIPTAEVPVTNIHQGEILDADQLPIKYVAYTPCFRSEAGSYGKDTRGYIRQHQFNKVEVVRFCLPEESEKNLAELTADAEDILKRLELPYRVVTLCTGDMGFASAKTYDIEVWLPEQNTYREISSCSTFTDFQARRANIRFRRAPKAKPEFVHTLNGSGLAVGRTLVAIFENYQQRDGSVRVPKALAPYLDGVEVISKRC